MKTQLRNMLLSGIAVMFFSCSSQKYISNSESYNRQQEIKEKRSENILNDILSSSVSVVSSAMLETDIDWQLTGQQFKKLNLVNHSKDTLYVNMLTDVYWDKDNYCDFMDIRIPPKEKCKILVPADAQYNVYFSNTPQSDDDEMLQINTSDMKQLILEPGITMFSKTN